MNERRKRSHERINAKRKEWKRIIRMNERIKEKE